MIVSMLAAKVGIFQFALHARTDALAGSTGESSWDATPAEGGEMQCNPLARSLDTQVSTL